MSWGIVAAVAPAVIGGLMGSKGQQSSQTVKQEMDPRMVPYIFGQGGQGGLLSGAQGQMQRSTSPERMAQLDMMRQQGAGLLGGAVAGNPWFTGYGGGQLGGHMDPSMIKNGLPNSYANMHPQAQQAMFPPPPAQGPAQPPAPNPGGNQQFSIDELLKQLREQQGGIWNNMPGGA
jgi:hypothetical protein